MSGDGTGTPNPTLEQLPEMREKTEALSDFLAARLNSYLTTLRPAFAPSRILGRFTRAGKGAYGSTQAVEKVRERFREVCGNPFSLQPELDDEVFDRIENELELYPWEYEHEPVTEKEGRPVTITSPVRWVLAYKSGYSLARLRPALAGSAERRSDGVRQFVVNALVLGSLIEMDAGLRGILSDLRFPIRPERAPGLGELPVVTLSACLQSFRPSDSLIVAATRLSGVQAFIELIDVSQVDRLEDPLKKELQNVLAGL